MVAQTVFANAFVADGIVPHDPPFRTVVEYRSRIYSVPPSDHSQPSSSAFQTGVGPPNPHLLSNNVPLHDPDRPGFLAMPDPAQAEHVVRHLATVVDLHGLGSFDPRYFLILSLVPAMFLNNASRPLLVQTPPPSQSFISTIRKSLTAFVTTQPPTPQPVLSLVSWHFSDGLVAFCTGPNLDRICAYNFKNAQCETSGERIPTLTGTTCLAFRPYAGRSLAVGCTAGVALLRGQTLDFLQAPGHTHIISLDWSPDASQLVTASAADGNVRLWHIGMHTSIVLSTGSMVRFSPNKASRYLFVANAASPSFRLWSCDTWRSERWGSLSGPVVAATWSKDGSTLLFSTQGETAIYVIDLGVDRGDEARIVHTEVTALPRQGPGGTPILLELDDAMERLAVAYDIPEHDVSSDPAEDDGEPIREDRHRRHAVALYAVQTRPMFRMSPVGYISGPPRSGPAIGLKFKPRPPGSVASVLTCMWRSGEVTFSQLVYNASAR